MFNTYKSIALISILLVSVPTSISAGNTEISFIVPAKLAWQTTPEGVAFAPLIGQRFNESYMAMVSLPSGTTSPAHTKSANMFGVIISGQMSHSPLGTSPDDEVVLPSGSFYKIPKNMPHVSKCVSTEECITFLYQDGKFDFLPVVQE